MLLTLPQLHKIPYSNYNLTDFLCCKPLNLLDIITFLPFLNLTMQQQKEYLNNMVYSFNIRFAYKGISYINYYFNLPFDIIYVLTYKDQSKSLHHLYLKKGIWKSEIIKSKISDIELKIFLLKKNQKLKAQLLQIPTSKEICKLNNNRHNNENIVSWGKIAPYIVYEICYISKDNTMVVHFMEYKNKQIYSKSELDFTVKNKQELNQKLYLSILYAYQH